MELRRSSWKVKAEIRLAIAVEIGNRDGLDGVRPQARKNSPRGLEGAIAIAEEERNRVVGDGLECVSICENDQIRFVVPIHVGHGDRRRSFRDRILDRLLKTRAACAQKNVDDCGGLDPHGFDRPDDYSAERNDIRFAVSVQIRQGNRLDKVERVLRFGNQVELGIKQGHVHARCNESARRNEQVASRTKAHERLLPSRRARRTSRARWRRQRRKRCMAGQTRGQLLLKIRGLADQAIR